MLVALEVGVLRELVPRRIFVRHTQRELRYPGEGDVFFERCERVEAERGDAIVFFGIRARC